MPRKPAHPCKHRGCPNLTYGEYCEEHAVVHANEYNKYCRRQGSDKAYGTAWKKVRAEYIKRHPCCERCLESKRYVPAELVHHILPVAYGGSNDESNLKALCRSCHEWIHKHEVGDK